MWELTLGIGKLNEKDLRRPTDERGKFLFLKDPLSVLL